MRKSIDKRRYFFKIKRAGVAQLVEHGTENPGVRSSILRPGIIKSLDKSERLGIIFKLWKKGG